MLTEKMFYKKRVTQTCPSHLQEEGIVDGEQYEFTTHKKTLLVLVDGQH
jgi:hypothetical protein